MSAVEEEQKKNLFDLKRNRKKIITRESLLGNFQSLGNSFCQRDSGKLRDGKISTPQWRNAVSLWYFSTGMPNHVSCVTQLKTGAFDHLRWWWWQRVEFNWTTPWWSVSTYPFTHNTYIDASDDSAVGKVVTDVRSRTDWRIVVSLASWQSSLLSNGIMLTLMFWCDAGLNRPVLMAGLDFLLSLC